MGRKFLRRLSFPMFKKARTYGILALNLIEICQMIRATCAADFAAATTDIVELRKLLQRLVQRNG